MRSLFVVPKARVAAANAAAVKLFGPHAANAFSVPVSYNKSSKDTHYVACWEMSKDMSDKLVKEIGTGAAASRSDSTKTEKKTADLGYARLDEAKITKSERSDVR